METREKEGPAGFCDGSFSLFLCLSTPLEKPRMGRGGKKTRGSSPSSEYFCVSSRCSDRGKRDAGRLWHGAATLCKVKGRGRGVSATDREEEEEKARRPLRRRKSKATNARDSFLRNRQALSTLNDAHPVLAGRRQEGRVQFW